MLQFSCSGTQQVQLCTSAADCTNAGNGNNMCCTFSGGDGGSLSFCASSFIGSTGGGTCK